MAAALAMALIMNQKIRGITFWRTIFFLPSVTAGVAVYLLWAWIYDPQKGLLNQFLNATLGYFHLFPKDPTRVAPMDRKRRPRQALPHPHGPVDPPSAAST